MPNVIDDINSVNGLAVGVRANAIHDGNTVTYSLTDSAGGRFSIDEVTGVISVLDHTLIDRSENPNHVVEVMAMSTSGTVVSQTFTINVEYLYLTSVVDKNEMENHIKEAEIINDLSVGITGRAFHDNNTISYSLTRGEEYGFTVNSETGEVSIKDKDVLIDKIQTYYILEITATSSSGDTSASQFKLKMTPVPFMSFDFDDNKVENGFDNWSYSDIGANECDIYAGIGQSKLCNEDGSKFFPYYNPHNNSHIGWTRYGFFDSEPTLSVSGNSMKVLMTGGVYEDNAGLLQEAGIEIKSKSQYLENLSEANLIGDRDVDGRIFFITKQKPILPLFHNLRAIIDFQFGC
ncbi:hypothetical protein [Psychrosphaera algicola]|uniref:Cadherin domain-containing protein n=1 Tax=Psychrosphaera algicola TaxID=3023714 RepID=A0ABT5FER8_9GAMM|nr:hypothetical protein [Psychrosphaera sp. G1-22]MDC2890022.1 hypothetical protein [Psychrosphaera sp. G1-22]